MLSRAKPAVAPAGSEPTNNNGNKTLSIPRLDQFVSNRDYTGAITMLEFQKATGKFGPDVLHWLAYCAYHIGDYKKAMEVCLFFLQDFQGI